MTCNEARTLLDDAAAERSDDALPGELRGHLDGCADCRAERLRSLEVLRQLDAARDGLVALRPRFEESAALLRRPAPSSWSRVLAAASILIIALPVFWLLVQGTSRDPGGISRAQDERILALIDLLKDPSPERRARAQEDLVDVGPAAARPVKAALDRSSDREVRERLARIAAIYRSQEILGTEFGRRFSRSDDAVEKLSMLVKFLESRSPRPLKDSDQATLTEEIHRNIGRDDQLRLIDLFADPRGKNVPWEDEAVAREYAWVLPPLLSQQDSEVVARAVTALARLGGLPSDASSLTRSMLPSRIAELLDSKNKTLRRCALEALGNLKARAYIPNIVRALSDADPSVQIRAVEVLRDLKAAESIEGMAVLLDARNSDVRAHVLIALGELGGRAYAPRMAQALSDKGPVGTRSALRIAALKGLRALKAVEYLPDISAVLKDPDGFLRALAVDTLGALGAKDRVTDVEQRLKDPDEMVRVFAAQTLAVLGVPSSKAPLEDALRTEKDPDVRAAIVEALQRLGKARND